MVHCDSFLRIDTPRLPFFLISPNGLGNIAHDIGETYLLQRMHILLELSFFSLKRRTHLGTGTHELDSILQRCPLVRIRYEPSSDSLLPLLYSLLLELMVQGRKFIPAPTVKAFASYLSKPVTFQASCEPLGPVVGVFSVSSQFTI
jgi:hypothetical protein